MRQVLDEPRQWATGPSTSAQLLALQHLEYIALLQRPPAPARLTGAGGIIQGLRDNFGRLCLFAFNGLLVFVVGLGLQAGLIRFAGMGHDLSYVVQTVVSVQLGFTLARYLTWRDRATDFLSALGRYNMQQLVATGIGMLLYAGLERLGMNYIIANIAVTGILTPISFLISHKWSMTDSK